MLVKFTVGNFLSFKEPVPLDLTATRIGEYSDSNVRELEKLKLLKSAVIYGANASGKSNLLKAMAFMRHLVINSSKESQSNEEIDTQPFLFSTVTENTPSLFEIIFYLSGVRYRYGFEADKHKIREEWLYFTNKETERKLFVREDDQIYINVRSFREGKGLEEKTRENALFLSVVSQFNGEIATKLLEWFQTFNKISGISDKSYASFTLQLLRSGVMKSKIVQLLKIADTGINDIIPNEFEISPDRIPKGISLEMKDVFLKEMIGKKMVNITSSHNKYDENDQEVGSQLLDFSFESAGTRKFFNLSGPILDTIERGGILLIDELDSRLHPLLTRAIARLFNSNKTNTNNAQLIFTTHDTNLLNAQIFRRDQIWFTEKNRIGATDLYSLSEYRDLLSGDKIRNDASFEPDYIRGRYGAIPYLGNFAALLAGE